MNDEVVSLVAQAVEELPTLIANFSAAQPPQFDPALIILQSHNLLAGLPLSHGMEVQDERDEANVTEASVSETQLPLQAQPPVTTESDNIAAPQIPAVLLLLSNKQSRCLQTLMTLTPTSKRYS